MLISWPKQKKIHVVLSEFMDGTIDDYIGTEIIILDCGFVLSVKNFLGSAAYYFTNFFKKVHDIQLQLQRPWNSLWSSMYLILWYWKVWGVYWGWIQNRRTLFSGFSTWFPRDTIHICAYRELYRYQNSRDWHQGWTRNNTII